MDDEKRARARSALSGSGSLRPMHAKYAKKFELETAARDIITKEHGCKHKFMGACGRWFECTHELWATA
eukprot:1655064-Pleurochrysis_carterae.AAC.1